MEEIDMRKENLYLKQYGKVVEVEIYMYFNDVPEIKKQQMENKTEKILDFVGKDEDSNLDIYEVIDSGKVYGVVGKHNSKWNLNEE